MDHLYLDYNNLRDDTGRPESTSFDWGSKDDFQYFTHENTGGLFDFEFLNQRDYSLNSPIISDELLEFSKYTRDKSFRDDWSKNVWEKSIKFFKESGVPIIEEREVKDFHKYWGNLTGSDFPNPEIGNSILDKADDGAKITSNVPKTFIETVFKADDIKIPDSKPISKYCRGLFHLFSIFHWIVNIMNAKTSKELENIRSFLDCFESTRLDLSERNVKLQIQDVGTFLITPNFVYHMEERRLLSLSHILMMKDTLIGRVNTLLYLSWRIDPLLLDFNVTKLEKWYQLGDRLMSKLSNIWFDVLGMIEPSCNLQFVKSSSKLRPLIPIDKDFEHHVTNKIKEHSELDPQIMEFFDYILDDLDVHSLCVKYGAFRHWGHPEIEYLEGLEKLHTQVQMPKEIDENYANALASDLAFLVLSKKFREHHKWYIDIEQVSEYDPLYDHLKNKTFPQDSEIVRLGDIWHLYPLLPCFEIPDVIEPSEIYSDKSHSMPYSDVYNHISKRKRGKIPSLRVLSTLLKNDNTNWKDFLQRVNDVGISKEMLIIGLKAKEREIKRVGRFFALMSWELREYFVVTEYLIKKHYVPLFSGLTMADDLATVTKKMLDRVSGQGDPTYNQICYANHIDYNKWNNHQRFTATSPVFRVMGQFLGYPKLIERTHEFFEKSFIYYNNRPDLMEIGDNDQIESKEGYKVCWNGQAGGLEGLRQKGWSILNLLVIRREGRLRSTKVSVLAQGDNQVVCTHYQAQDFKTSDDLVTNLQNLHSNNSFIMARIVEGTKKLGLIINQDETIHSSDYLNYGKVPIWRGNICSLSTKRWSRVCCVTNDQLPTMANLMSSVTTSALTVANFSPTPIPSILALNFFGNLVRTICDMHNPALRSSIRIEQSHFLEYYIGFIYLDPSIGGISGTSLTRFLIRGFPDPVTESLSFWKCLADNTVSPQCQSLYKKILNVPVMTYNPSHFGKLLENPTSLNIQHGINPETLIKEHIKNGLLADTSKLKNSVIREMLINHKEEEKDLNNFLESITPRFPRFNSEFKAGTFVGIANGVIGLFQNAKTIRSVFKTKFVKDINQIVRDAEMISLKTMVSLKVRREIGDYHCTSQLADKYREMSWGHDLVGCTVPHPLEMFGNLENASLLCKICKKDGQGSHITTRVRSSDFLNLFSTAGPYPPYLGSTTSESTSILTPWEQKSNIPIIRKADHLRKSIGWFVSNNSRLGKSILQNLKALTGIEWKGLSTEFRRTGSALHRFGSERQSAGGYNATSPTVLSRIYSTTDHLTAFQEKNYDFMFQSSIIYAQITSGVIYVDQGETIVHHHIKCPSCIREIQEIQLESAFTLDPSDKSDILNMWKPATTSWTVELLPQVELEVCNWIQFDLIQQSYLIGRIQGFLYGLLEIRSDYLYNRQSIFPQVLGMKVDIDANIEGIVEGLAISGGLQTLHRSFLYNKKSPHRAFIGSTFAFLRSLTNSPEFLAYSTGPDWETRFLSVSHLIPPSYPPTDRDRALYISNYIIKIFINTFVRKSGRSRYQRKVREIIIFSDIIATEFSLPLSIGVSILSDMLKDTVPDSTLHVFREKTDILSKVYSKELTEISLSSYPVKILLFPEESRHALTGRREITESSQRLRIIRWGTELTSGVIKIPVLMVREKREYPLPMVGIRKSPLMSGLRTFKFATTSHYKIRSILNSLGVIPKDFICLADGSGGITALCLRMFPLARGLFNSLIDLRNTTCIGQDIGLPTAIKETGIASERCINLFEVSQKPSDLTCSQTWTYLKGRAAEAHMEVELAIIDLEADDVTRAGVEIMMSRYLPKILKRGGICIYKTQIDSPQIFNTLKILGNIFPLIDIYQSEVSSSFTNEIYIVGSGRQDKPRSLHPDLVALNHDIRVCHCFQTDKAEFKRIVKFKKQDFNKGVPPFMLPSPSEDLMNCLLKFGVPSTIAVGIFDQLELNDIPDLSKIYALFLIGGHGIYYHSSYKSSQLVPPSDTVVSKLISWTFGFSYFISLIKEDFYLFKYLNDWYVKRIPFYWKSHLEHYGKYVIKWSFREKSRYFKALYPDGNSSDIINLIRTLQNLTQCQERLPIASNIINIVKPYLRHVDVLEIPNNTGFFDLIEKRPIPEPTGSETIEPLNLRERVYQYDMA